MRIARILLLGELSAAALSAAGACRAEARAMSPAGRPPDDLAQETPSDTRANQEELERLKKAAAEKRRQAEKLVGEEKGVLSRLRKSNEALNATRRYLQKLEVRENAVQNEIEVRARDIEVANSELSEGRRRLAAWMRHAYKHGSTRGAEVLFSAASFSDLLKRTYFLSMVLDQERRLLESVRENRARIEAEKKTLEARHLEITGVRLEKENERKKYQGLKQAQQAEVSRIRSQRKSYEQAAREMEAAAARLKKLMDDLEAERKRRLKEGRDAFSLELDRNNFGANRGRLPWPVSGDVIGRFGLETHPEWGTQVRNNGLDIQAPEGTAVRAVGDGRVEMADWLSGYGQSVILNHGQGYYTIYAHLSSIGVGAGDRVTAGQTIGAVGDSESLKGDCLHFEVRRGREAQDPARWLR